MEKNANSPCSCSCGASRPIAKEPWIAGTLQTSAGNIPVVSDELGWADRIGGWKARWGHRGRYQVAPGLYALGTPVPTDVILVTANYKLTFDKLRQELAGINAWILVLDTRGINVWCAAGKGTFSTSEVIRQIESTKLKAVTSNRTLVLPQLGASGVSGYQVKRETGYNVVYGPVRARDLPEFLKNGMKASEKMRAIQFPFRERLVLIPVELISVLKYFFIYFILAGALSFLLGRGTLSNLATLGFPVLGALLVGIVLVPALLPFLPFRSFTLKGWIPGILWAVVASWWAGAGNLQFLGNLLLLPILSAGFALTFTGSSTYTSQTGVNKEIRLFARPMAILGVLGMSMMVVNWFV
jgi:hypothetical protein